MFSFQVLSEAIERYVLIENSVVLLFERLPKLRRFLEEKLNVMRSVRAKPLI